MANAHSKILQREEEYYDDEYPQQKLVLYIQECDKDIGKDMCCFIMYDDYEGEYLINGVRQPLTKNTTNQYTFYCKKRKSLLHYLKSVFDDTNNLEIVLYNYSNENDDLYYLDFEQLYSNKVKKNYKNEISGYNGCPVNEPKTWETIKMFLKNLKYIRY